MGGFKLQMSWMPSLLSQKRRNGPPLGLRNLDNTCYLNSVLQCLTYTPPFANFCLSHKHTSHCDSIVDGERKRDCPFCIVEKRITRSLSVDLTVDAPSKISNCLNIFAEHFKSGRQEDAHEFLRYVIDACHNTCLRLKKLRRKGAEPLNGNTAVREIFGGALQSQVKCLSCGAESNKADEIMDISLEILNCSSMKESMQKFFQPEILDGNNKYRCENCKKLVAARKQMSLLQAPNILVVQLKRFEGVFGGKIDKAIAFGEILFLSSFMNKASKDPQPEYKLFGIIVHAGLSPECGHYYAYVKDALGQWYCCDDSSVSLSTLQEVLSKKAYILFFSRSNQRPASAKTLVASNGTTSQEVSGCETSKPQKPVGAQKPVGPLTNGNMRLRTEQSFTKDNLASFRVRKVPLNPLAKVNISVNLGAKRVSPTLNGRLSFNQDEHIVPKEIGKDSNQANKENSPSFSSGTVNSGMEKKFGTENGGNRVKENGSAALSNNHEASLPSPHQHNGSSNGGDHHKDNLHPCESNGLKNGDHHREIENDSSNTQSKAALDTMTETNEDPCILLRKDDTSRAKLEAIQESLKKDASSYLRSCGWYDKVEISMRARKRLCTEQQGGDGNSLKKRLIADVKSSLKSQIPEELKSDLVNRIWEISQKKYSPSGS